ncbi:hypothetical protein PHYSODRAFT_502591 [Phytophthora sojae]|uniref:Uncharacterized protein n=1 Tax=Phytophthora sojae (strain P6497) TaxID=1094619 RepID=G4ZHH7_PHYSP|nr:hypothetical protein PHYSODRAFT_502591 [Phytophthora sojae]EGZ18057.1 hypothetical protein PHYSODRAFT_502591 [Phytophthora sojae]|eukprot:XP_009527115.1 hypothetical protein PHYSODRAFT_502591 [Phytophthora sojae]
MPTLQTPTRRPTGTTLLRSWPTPSFTDAQRFRVDEDYALSSHWNGGNLKNATLNPLNVSVDHKIVFAPHAHAHGVRPQNYFYTPDSNCTDDVEHKLGCSDSHFACSSYEHISVPETLLHYEVAMREALGDLRAQRKIPLVLGAFSGVYGVAQPHQTAVLDYLIDLAASLQGGYFYALNPDVERYSEDSGDGQAGTMAVTHYGLMQTSSWQEPYADLLEALQRIPSTEIPCFGGKESSGGSSVPAANRDAAFALLVISLAFFLCDP